MWLHQFVGNDWRCSDVPLWWHKARKPQCVFFFDKFFCSIPLIEALTDCGIYGTGTCRAKRPKGANQKLKSKKQLTEEGWGVFSVVSDNATVQFNYPHGLILCWPVPWRCGQEMGHEGKNNAQGPKTLFCCYLQLTRGWGRSHWPMCGNVSPQT